jgi:hypothetical protein
VGARNRQAAQRGDDLPVVVKKGLAAMSFAFYRWRGRMRWWGLALQADRVAAGDVVRR